MSFYRGGRKRVGIEFGNVSRTKRQFKDECDINILMAKYQKGFAITHFNRFQGSYADVTGAVDYQEACNIVLRSQDMFMSLPSSVRARFENDPGQFLEFASRSENLDELRRLGLARPLEAVADPVPGAAQAVPGTPPKGGEG